MTNSCIISLNQDALGRMWIGSCDGINIYDGHDVTTFNINGYGNYISGNLIDEIHSSNHHLSMIRTHFGLNIVDLKRNIIQHYIQYKLTYAITQSREGIFMFLCGLKGSNRLYYYHAPSHSFKFVPIHWINKGDVKSLFMDRNNVLWIVTNNKVYNYKILVNKDSDIFVGDSKQCHFSHHPIVYSTYDDGYIHYVDNQYNLYSYNMTTRRHIFIRNLKDLSSRGFVSSILLHHGDFFIGYSYKGVVILKKQQQGYSVQSLPINVGIFCMVKDRFQDVIWIGSDGQGVYLYSNTHYSIKSVTFKQFGIETPVRCLYWDKDRTLWVGTKGDGIVKFFNYDPEKSAIACRTEKITVKNQPSLANDAVYGFTPSKAPLLWIATDRGISYYSYLDHQYHHISLSVKGKELCDVHQIYETNNSELWLVSTPHKFLTGLSGVYRVKISGSPGHPVLNNLRHYSVDNGDPLSNSFFSIYAQSDSQLFFANKTGGAYRYDAVHDVLVRVSRNNSETFSYVTDINYDHRGHYLWATNHGLIKYQSDSQYQIFDSQKSISNGTIHSIIYNAPNDIWFSTNMGLVHYDAVRDLFHTYGYNEMMSVIEFSDGAAYKDAQSGAIFFGGINGFVCIQSTGYRSSLYMPDLHVSQLSIFGKDVNPYVYVSGTHPHHIINLGYKQNFFSISFSASDYINGSNYVFYYRLKGSRGQWIDNGQNNTISFTNLDPGNYKLEMKYFNTAINRESKIYVFDICIAHPWYDTFWAYMVYLSIIALIARFFIRDYIKRKRHRKEEEMKDMQMKHEKEISDSKLNFFMVVAQEFSTPLTLISGPCERILSIAGIGKTIVNYAHLIEANANRLNNLIHELVEFRFIEIGNRKPKIQNVCITGIAVEIARSYKELADSRNITYQSKISENLKWNTDRYFFSTIIANLIANSFHYTDNAGNVKLEIIINNDSLIFRIVNSINDINIARLRRIFDQNAILNNFENSNATGISENQLGLALSRNMIALLNGSLTISTTDNHEIEISAIFPSIPQSDIDTAATIEPNFIVRHPILKDHLILPHYETTEMRLTMFVIESEINILWLIGDIFSNEFNIIPVQNVNTLDELLSNDLPNLVICDMNMPQMNGLEITQKLKSNKETQHIPIILLSNKYEIEEQTKALSTGAEMYITKPFSVNMLKVSVQQCIKREENLRTYFNSPLSSFEKSDGQYLHKESKKFLQSVLKIIKDHIAEKELTPSFIANELNIGPRNLYRKMSEIGKGSPADLIRDCRLKRARQLLLTSKFTVSEIVFKSGFTNKVSFFKLFHDVYGCTPKEYREKNDITK